jgi:hypothetical protein
METRFEKELEMPTTTAPLLSTLTGEHFQPVRLHYQLFDEDGLTTAFKKLRCVQRDSGQDRWVWLYEHEAKMLQSCVVTGLTPVEASRE